MKKLSIIIILLTLILTTSAQTYTTKDDGDWSDTTTWMNGDIPPFDLNNTLSININHNVIVGSWSSYIDIYMVIDSGDTLELENGIKLKFTGNIINNGVIRSSGNSSAKYKVKEMGRVVYIIMVF